MRSKHARALVGFAAAAVFGLATSSTASAAFTPSSDSPFATGGNPYTVVIAKLNGGANPDIATVNGDGSVTVLLGTGDGNFTEALGSPIDTGGDATIDMAAADFDGDTDTDLAVADAFQENVRIFLNDGGGEFTQAGSPILVNSPTAIAAGKLDTDGDVDLAFGQGGSPAKVNILLGNGSGGFSGGGSYTPGGTGASDIVIAPIDGAAGNDIAMSNTNTNNVAILLNNGSGAFSAAPGSPVTVGLGPIGLAAGKFDGDSDQDLAVANNSGDSVSVLLGNGSGGFSAAPGSPVEPGGDAPVSIALGDLTGDGKVDVLAGNYSTANAAILAGDGTGRMTEVAGSPVETAGCACAVAVGDVNGDGALDFASSNRSATGRVSVLLNGGGGGGSGPDTTITKHPKKKLKAKKKKTTAKFGFEAVGATGATFECKLDKKPYKVCESPQKYKVGKGKHKFQVRAVLGTSVDSTPAKFNFTVKKKGKKKHHHHRG